jgi:hypothetical protein
MQAAAVRCRQRTHSLLYNDFSVNIFRLQSVDGLWEDIELALLQMSKKGLEKGRKVVERL